MGGSSSRAPPPLDLPQQEVVAIAHTGSLRNDRHGMAAVNAAARVAQKCETGQVKVQMAWQPHSFELHKGAGRTLWELHGSFTSEVPCTLTVCFFCRERSSPSGQKVLLTYEPADGKAPPGWTQQYPAGKHDVRLEGPRSIDVQRHPLEVFWRLKKSLPDVLPIVFALEAEGVQSIVHMALQMPPPSRDQVRNAVQQTLQCQMIRQKVVIDRKEYLLQEIYGLADLGKDDSRHDESSQGEPCVICLTDPRTTAILPCRHLCLCQECAQQLSIGAQVQGDTCPICRGRIDSIQVFEVKTA